MLGWWVRASVGLDLSLDSLTLLFSTSKFVHLADGTKRDFNGDSSKLMAVPLIAFLDKVSVSEKEVDLAGV